MRVLNLVTNYESRFYRQQVRTLGSMGVECETVALPTPNEAGKRRSLRDYARLVPDLHRESFADYDLVHANNGLTAPIALTQRSLPVVVSLWGTDVMGPFAPVTRRASRLCDAVVVMSEAMAGLVDGDPYVIPHGVDLDRFAPTPREAARAELGWDTDRPHVLFPYPPERGVKDYPRAQRAVAQVRYELARDVELVTVTGEPHDRMPLYYNAADALLLTSKREGSPNAVKEALACNCPVVSTPVGDVPERLDGVTNGHVCESQSEIVDGLVAVLDGEGRSDGREHVEAVSVDRVTERLRSVYDAVTDGRP